MSFEINGSLIAKYDIQNVTDTFSKREFVIEVENERDTRYNDTIKFQLTQDRCSMIDPANVGDNLKITFDIKGRKWEKNGQVNYFNNLEAWKIEVLNSSDSSSTPPPSMDDLPQMDAEEDDLPF